jgi:hypothetical protein
MQLKKLEKTGVCYVKDHKKHMDNGIAWFSLHKVILISDKRLEER